MSHEHANERAIERGMGAETARSLRGSGVFWMAAGRRDASRRGFFDLPSKAEPILRDRIVFGGFARPIDGVSVSGRFPHDKVKP